MRMLRTGFACLVFGALVPQVASAEQVLFSNFGVNNSYDTVRATFFGLDEEQTDPDDSFSRAMAFIPNATGRVTAVALPVEFPWFTEPGWTNGSLEINLFEAAGELPGRVLESFSSTGTHLPNTISMFESIARPQLIAGVLYFLEARTIGQANGLWSLSLSDSTQQVPDYRRIGNGPWEKRTRVFPAAAFSVSGDVDPAPVPEPSMLLLLASGLAIVARRRRLRVH